MTALRSTLLALLSSVALVGVATAAPIVAAGSDYSFRVTGIFSGVSNVASVSFDGIAESFTRTTAAGNQVDFTLNESQTDLGGGLWEIRVSLSTQGELFDVADETGLFGIGQPGSNPLELLSSVKLLSAVMTISGAGFATGSADFLAAFPGSFQNDPWNGYFINIGNVGGFGNLGGMGLTSMDLVFTVAQVPVPGSLLLALSAFGLLGWQRRRQI